MPAFTPYRLYVNSIFPQWKTLQGKLKQDGAWNIFSFHITCLVLID